jgi:uncharacterized membrane protein SpoIIM required for sporulation
MWAELRPALIITRREVRDQLRDWRIIFPVLGLTIFFPFLMNFTAKQALNFVEQYGASIIAERMVPFLFMVVGFFPVTVSLVIALESFVGEKERSSIEPLLNSPLKDWQLYLGKLISSAVPSILTSFLGMGVYILGLYLQHITLPEPALIAQIVTLTVVQGFVMVSSAVVVSTQATSVRAANLLASPIVIPVALLIQGESVMMFWGDYNMLWLVVFGLIVLTVLLVRVGLAHFQREELLGREIDVLNVRWGWGVFWSGVRGDAHSLPDWYRRILPTTLRRLKLPAAIMALLLLVSIWVGATQLSVFPDLFGGSSIDVHTRLENLTTAWPFFDFAPILLIWWQNLRSLLLALGLGILSFGILGVLPSMATFGILGYLTQYFAMNGIPAWQYLVGFILPHGLVEIPAIALAGAAVLQMGAILATPTPGKTLGEVWLGCLADWFKVMVGVVMPLLFISAAIEAWITPRVALWLVR